MTLATVIVLPEPVTPSRVWNRSPRSEPARQLRDRARLIARPARNGACRSKLAARHGRKIRGAPVSSSAISLAARHLGHTFHLARGLHDLLEMRQVLHLDERRAGDAAVHRVQLHALDVGPRGADGRGEVGVQAAPIVGFEGQADREPLAFRLLPVDLQPALGLVRQEQQVGTVAAVDADAATARDVAHDRDRPARAGSTARTAP